MPSRQLKYNKVLLNDWVSLHFLVLVHGQLLALPLENRITHSSLTTLVCDISAFEQA